MTSSLALMPCISKTIHFQTMVSKGTLLSIKLRFQRYIDIIQKNKEIPLKNNDVIVDFDPLYLGSRTFLYHSS